MTTRWPLGKHLSEAVLTLLLNSGTLAQARGKEVERCSAELQATTGAGGSLSPWQEVFGGEMDGGNPSFPSTTSLVPLSHKAIPSGRTVITHFTALILIMANVNIRIININAQNNAVICNYRVALIFLPFQPPHHLFPPLLLILAPALPLSPPPPPCPSTPGSNVITPPFHSELI